MTTLVTVTQKAGCFIASSNGIISRSSKTALAAVKKTALKRALGMRCPSLNYFEDSDIKITQLGINAWLVEHS